MDEDPFPGTGLMPVRLTDQAEISAYFSTLCHPLSDYTFSQLYTWRNSLRILWTRIDSHLCVFANGSGDLTMLLPPIGDGSSDRALAGAFEIMDAYNSAHGVRDHTRVEYASDELLARVDPSKVVVSPMGHDYVYDVQRMIDLPGGDLASKRQAKSRFMRNYPYRVETYDCGRHLSDCLRLLELWKDHQDEQRLGDPSLNAIKREKETYACELALQYADKLGLKGIVIYVQDPADGAWSLRAFTFGEYLGTRQSSIVIEKTDLRIKGLAQFIFSEFCRQCWADRPEVNVGDDWGLDTLAWTKHSYRPIGLMKKYILRPVAVPTVATGSQWPGVVASVTAPSPAAASAGSEGEPAPTVREARPEDVEAAVALERGCFDMYQINKRQLRYLQQRPTAVFLVAEENRHVVGEGIALVRHGHNGRATGRVYSLAVSQDCRGHHLGSRLMREMMGQLVGRGVERIYLEVEADNHLAIALYKRLGFQVIGHIPHYYGTGRHGLHMMCPATAARELAVA